MKLSASAKTYSLIATLVLLGCILCSCGSSVPQTTPSPELSPTPTNTSVAPTLQPSPGRTDYVEVVYFHRTQRCYGCQYAGDTTEYTVETYFANELANGKLVFKMVDVQDKANASIAERYGAYGSSLFINEIVDGIDHIEPVTDIWYHLGDDEKFTQVVKDAIEKHLGNI
ncbi:MAG: hypothetical protein A2Y59_06230 [Chloroflexi bacterium RBG_13_52_14]|nr:MAG: hypothetical protein A2Y59_06230 [Chloroflexi bacterium RBG_13_52_14]